MVQTVNVLKLIEALAEKCEEPLNYGGFKKMVQKIEGEVDYDYLDNVNRSVRKKIANQETHCRYHINKLNAIAASIGYKNFDDFCMNYGAPLSEFLKDCEGNWWSYVRENSEQPFLYKAPVRLYVDGYQKMQMILRGSERRFTGELNERGACLSGFLDSGEDKRIGLVFRFGRAKNIRVLHGVFCGMSSLGDPIAGREILIKEEEEIKFDEMKWERCSLDSESLDRRIRKFFSDYSANCIKVSGVKGFSLENI